MAKKLSWRRFVLVVALGVAGTTISFIGREYPIATWEHVALFMLALTCSITAVWLLLDLAFGRPNGSKH